MGKLAAFGFVHAAAAISLTAGARLLPATECAFLSALETSVAPLLAWVILADLPAPLTFVGGGLVLAALVWYMVRELRHAQRIPG